MPKGQGHWNGKCKNRFLRIPSSKLVDLRQTKTKIINDPFYTYRLIHFSSGNASFSRIFVCLSVCLSHTHTTLVHSVLERRKKVTFCRKVTYFRHWWSNFQINKKAVLSQRWPRDARYISRPWAVTEIWPFEIIQDGGGRHLEFVRIENSAIRSAVPENPTL